MPTITEIRQKYPQYNDLSDSDLADKLHAKFYPDMPRDQFDAKVGVGPVKTPKFGKRTQPQYAGTAEGMPFFDKPEDTIAETKAATKPFVETV